MLSDALDRALALRRPARRRARERGGRAGARRRYAARQARARSRSRRGVTGAAGVPLRPVLPLRRCQHRLRHLDLRRGAAGADHRRRRHGVRPAGRRARAARLGEVDEAAGRPRSRHRPGRCSAALLVARRRLRAGRHPRALRRRWRTARRLEPADGLAMLRVAASPSASAASSPSTTSR